MVNYYAARLAAVIKKTAPDSKASAEVLQYGAVMLFNGSAVLVSVLLLCALAGQLLHGAIVLVAYALLRFCTGGFHFRSARVCYLYSTGVLTAIALVPLPAASSLYLTGASLVLVLLFAPANLERHTRIPQAYYLHLKLIASLLVSLNFIIDSELLALTACVQAFTLIHRRRKKHEIN